MPPARAERFIQKRAIQKRVAPQQRVGGGSNKSGRRRAARASCLLLLLPGAAPPGSIIMGVVKGPAPSQADDAEKESPPATAAGPASRVTQQ